MTDFEAVAGDPKKFALFVVHKLTLIENEVEQLTGNGQPGRVGLLERKARLHDRFIWMLSGAFLFGATVMGWWVALAK